MERSLGPVSGELAVTIRTGKGYRLGDMRIEAFSIYHDANEPVGLSLIHIYYNEFFGKCAVKCATILKKARSVGLGGGDPFGLSEYAKMLFLSEARGFLRALKHVEEDVAVLRVLYRKLGELDAFQSVASYRSCLLYTSNINDGCGSTHMEALQRKMREGAYDVGFAFDGDADRCLAVDARGNLVDGDQIMALCATRMKQKGLLKRDTIVVTVMSNLGLHLFAEKAGMHLEVTKVGDRYVLERMLEQGYNIGGEQSGHVIFLDDNTTGDGLLSSLHVCQTMLELNQPLEELAGLMQVLPQVLLNVQATKEQKERYEQDPAVSAEIAFVEKQLKGAGRVLIRPSGTEPLIRVMLEGEHPEEIEAYAHRIAKAIENVK